ncbi:hypothetical protein BH11MYX1_BH11MYX1_44110 [soil metagenome]
MISVGSVIGGRFRIDQVLGSGGMGVVLAATHLELGHRVAIKLLRDEMAQSPAIVERFLREARAVVGLRTEHVCRVSDVGRLETGAPYIVMEMLEGVDLQRSVARAPLPLTTAVEYVLQACVALVEAHAAGIIHRDLKPANLFVTRRFDGGPLVKVLDFGIAKALTEPGAHLTHQSAMGSPGYMSPEQIQSARDVDVRTDIWALGVTLYQLLAARLPFPGANPTEIAIAFASDPPAPLELDPVLHAVVWKCLEKQPDRRYSSIGELMLALQPFGGPRARNFIGQASLLGGPTGGFAHVAEPVTREPVVSLTQATQGATGVTTGQSVNVPAMPTRTAPPSPPGKSRWLFTIALLLIVGIGGAVGGMLYTRQTRPAVTALADATALADTARGKHAEPPAVDAAVAVDARLAVDGDPWASGSAGDLVEPEVPADAAMPIDSGIPRTSRTVERPALDIAKAMRMQKVMMACQTAGSSYLELMTCVCKQPSVKTMPELRSICPR